MRDQLQQVVIDAINDSEGNSEKITDAILAALPAMIEAGIPDLVWEWYSNHCYVHKVTESYSIRLQSNFDGSWIVEWSVPGYCATFIEGVFPSLAAAKAAANAHNRATLMAALGMGVE